MALKLYQFLAPASEERVADVDGSFRFHLPEAVCDACNRCLNFDSISCPCAIADEKWGRDCVTVPLSEFEKLKQTEGWNAKFSKIGVEPLPGMSFGVFHGDIAGRPSDIVWLTPDQCFFSDAALTERVIAELGIDTIPAELTYRRKVLRYSALFARPLRLLHQSEYATARKWVFCPRCRRHWPDWIGQINLAQMNVDGSQWNQGNAHIARVVEFPSKLVVDEHFKVGYEKNFPATALFQSLNVLE